MTDLPDGEKSLRIWVLVLTECTNVTDRQTDTQTDRHRMTAKAAHRAAKIKQNCITMTSLKSEEGLLQKIHRISSFFDHPVHEWKITTRRCATHDDSMHVISWPLINSMYTIWAEESTRTVSQWNVSGLHATSKLWDIAMTHNTPLYKPIPPVPVLNFV